MARESRNYELKKGSREIKKSSCKQEMVNGKSSRVQKMMEINNKIKIYCNALQTEPNYFEAFAKEVNKSKVSDATVEVIKTQKKGGLDPYSAVEYVIKNKGDCSNVWVVFDKDHFDIEKAIRLAEENKINIAWSNECFELWLILHFNYITTSLDRKESLKKIKELIKKNCGIDYDKNSKKIYELTKEKIKIAVAYSKKQYQLMKRDKVTVNKANPCNTVFKLVEVLLKSIDNE